MKILKRILGSIFTMMLFMTGAVCITPAATIVVDSASDGFLILPPGHRRPCRLRDAIHAANDNIIVEGCAKGDPSPAVDEILFNIGTGTPTIRLRTMLPVIIEPVIIRGDSYGATRVELDGSDASVTSALLGQHAHGLFLIGGKSTIRNMVINRFSGNGIVLTDPDSSTPPGDYTPPTITDPSVIQDPPCFARPAEPDCPPGGGGGNPDISPIVGGSGGKNLIIGCFIGTDATGTIAMGNGSGVQTAGVVADADSNIIGGTTPAECNVISANHGHGIILGGVGNLVRGNFIGTDATGTLRLGNEFDGINIAGGGFSTALGAIGANRMKSDAQCGLVIDSNGVVVNDRRECGNWIAFNNRNGISAGWNHLAFLSNSIFSNGSLGIDVDEFGLTPNAPDSARNFPVLTSWRPAYIVNGPIGTIVYGSISNVVDIPVTIQFFHSSACDPSNHGEGQEYVGSITVPGNGAFNFFLPRLGGIVTATATTTLRWQNTSEFSACLSISGSPPL